MFSAPPREPWMLPGTLPGGLALRLAKQLRGHDQVKQLKAVVDRGRLQMRDRRDQRRRPPRGRMAPEPRRRDGKPVARPGAYRAFLFRCYRKAG